MTDVTKDESFAAWREAVANGETLLGHDEWMEGPQRRWQAAVAAGETTLGQHEWERESVEVAKQREGGRVSHFKRMSGSDSIGNVVLETSVPK